MGLQSSLDDFFAFTENSNIYKMMMMMMMMLIVMMVMVMMMVIAMMMVMVTPARELW